MIYSSNKKDPLGRYPRGHRSQMRISHLSDHKQGSGGIGTSWLC
jgi:hypothetical protein